MTDSTKAKMFLADERGLEEEDSFRSYQTFNSGEFFSEYKIPFGNLYVANDNTLAGAHARKMVVTESSCLILLPVVGAVDYKDSTGNVVLINAAEIIVLTLTAGVEFEVSNPYENELVNYLQLMIRLPDSKTSTAAPFVTDFDLVLHKNKLITITGNPVFHPYPLHITIGQFRGREEALYELKDQRSGVFIFIVEGAFEVQGRLLHPRDALALWDVNGPVDMEALSNEAIVLAVEVKV